MSPAQRESHMDVSNSVDVTDPRAVSNAIKDIFSGLFKQFDGEFIAQAVLDCGRLYSGEIPGYRACDVGYHNIQHVLDVSLTMARLIAGHERSESQQRRFGAEMATVGLFCALFHDSGYIRRTRDTRHSSGGAYTLTHIDRSARFMAEYLETQGRPQWIGLCKQLVQFTACDKDVGEICIGIETQCRLGQLLGTADLMTQVADVNYVEKCRDSLYSEFEAAGIAGSGAYRSLVDVKYESAEHLLETTPSFLDFVMEERLPLSYDGVYRYIEVVFDGRNPYFESIEANRLKLQRELSQQRTSA